MESVNRCKPDYNRNNAHLRMVACIWRKLRGINLKLGNAGKGSCDRNWSINQVVLAHIPKMFHNPVFYFGGSALEINQKFKQPIYRKNTIKPTENRFHAIHFSLAIYLARWSAYQIKTGSHMQAFCQTAYQQWIFCGQNLGLLSVSQNWLPIPLWQIQIQKHPLKRNCWQY